MNTYPKIDAAFMRQCALGGGFNFPKIAVFLNAEEMQGYVTHVLDSAIAGGELYLTSKSMGGMRQRYEAGLKTWVESIPVEAKIKVLMSVGTAKEIESIAEDIAKFTSKDKI